MPFDIGVPELMLVLVVMLIAFGPDKIPEMARSFGKTVRDFRRMADEYTRDFTLDTDEPPADAPPANAPPANAPPPQVSAPGRRVCARCSTHNPLESAFCSQCGNALHA